MKKCTKIILISFLALMFLLSAKVFAAPTNLKDIDVNSLNFNSIDKNKVEDFKKALNNIDITNLDSASIIDNIDKNELASR